MSNEPRNQVLRVRCTKDEIRQIDEAAHAGGFENRSDWVRAASKGDTTVIVINAPVEAEGDSEGGYPARAHGPPFHGIVTTLIPQRNCTEALSPFSIAGVGSRPLLYASS